MQEIRFTVRLFAANGEPWMSELRCPRSRQQDFLNFGFEWSVFGHHVQGQLSVARDAGQQGLKSCATPAAKFPIASLFWDGRSWASSRNLSVRSRPSKGTA